MVILTHRRPRTQRMFGRTWSWRLPMMISPCGHQAAAAGLRRRGLTLIELIVVLMVLVALAGILVPMLPSMLTRAHVAAHVTNVVEIAKAITTYQALNSGYPDQWDSLTDGT